MTLSTIFYPLGKWNQRNNIRYVNGSEIQNWAVLDLSRPSMSQQDFHGKHLPESFSLTPPKPSVTSKGPSKHGFIQLFMWPNLRKKTLICYYLWFSTALIYYGLTLNSNTLGTELFTTFSIGKVSVSVRYCYDKKIKSLICQLLEFPSITLVIFLLLKTGRRITLILFYRYQNISCRGIIL